MGGPWLKDPDMHSEKSGLQFFPFPLTHGVIPFWHSLLVTCPSGEWTVRCSANTAHKLIDPAASCCSYGLEALMPVSSSSCGNLSAPLLGYFGGSTSSLTPECSYWTGCRQLSLEHYLSSFKWILTLGNLSLYTWFIIIISLSKETGDRPGLKKKENNHVI